MLEMLEKINLGVAFCNGKQLDNLCQKIAYCKITTSEFLKNALLPKNVARLYRKDKVRRMFCNCRTKSFFISTVKQRFSAPIR